MKQQTLNIIILFITVIAGAVGSVVLMYQLPSAWGWGIDMRFAEVRGGIDYISGDPLHNPPWSLVPLMLISILPDLSAYGVLVWLTLVVLVVSVPSQPRWSWFAGVLVLVVSFPSFRVIADAQMEAQIIAGVLLLMFGIKNEEPFSVTVGVLLATIKPQAVWLLLLAVGFYILRNWKLEKTIASAVLVLAVSVAYLVAYPDWIQSIEASRLSSGIWNISAVGSLSRAGLPAALIGILVLAVLAVSIATVYQHGITRTSAGMLLAAGMLTAPYTGGNTILVVLAIGIIPNLKKYPYSVIMLLLLINSQWLINSSIYRETVAYGGTVVLAVCWCWLVYASRHNKWLCYDKSGDIVACEPEIEYREIKQ